MLITLSQPRDRECFRSNPPILPPNQSCHIQFPSCPPTVPLLSHSPIPPKNVPFQFPHGRNQIAGATDPTSTTENILYIIYFSRVERLYIYTDNIVKLNMTQDKRRKIKIIKTRQCSFHRR